jgi:cytidylate kinase
LTITISRELGSGGTAIGREVAGRLGYRFVWREAINEAAQRAGARDVALAAIDDLGLLGLRPTRNARRPYRQAVADIMAEMAGEGHVVIVGRAGQVILADRSSVFHVRIVRSLEARVECLVARHGICSRAARAQVAASDRNRAAYLRREYGVDWNDPKLYDLMMRTYRVSIVAAADAICTMLQDEVTEN